MSWLARPFDRTPPCLAGKGTGRDVVESLLWVHRAEEPLP
jgi:hypothetical protein